jgi:hypothetical protein
MMISEMRCGTNVDKDQLQEELARRCFVQNAFQVDSLTKLNKQKLAISDRK